MSEISATTSEATATASSGPTEPANTADAPAQQDGQDAKPKPTETVDYWKSKSRDWERQSKENKKAADELAQIKEAQKTEAEKAADKLAAETERANAAEGQVLAFKIATEFSLDSDDAALVANQPDEESMRAIAKRLAAGNQDKQDTSPKHDPTQGGKGGNANKSKGDQFADWANSQFTH